MMTSHAGVVVMTVDVERLLLLLLLFVVVVVRRHHRDDRLHHRDRLSCSRDVAAKSSYAPFKQLNIQQQDVIQHKAIPATKPMINNGNHPIVGVDRSSSLLLLL
jgi:hypothetical protein